MGTGLEITDLRKSYGKEFVLQISSLNVESGEIMSILGPSGSGKTTMLKCIGGLEQPDAGRITIGTNVVNSVKDKISVPPEARNLGYVPQDYALWPHMTVFDQVAFPLRARKVGKDLLEQKVQRMLGFVNIENLRNRKPSQISAGQQQRAALARALVYEPSILLLDEPLANLDVPLRRATRIRLKSLIEELGMTTLMVTHDPEDALAMSDKLAILISGKLVQVGRPQEVYSKPSCLPVAELLGGINLISCRLLGEEARPGSSSEPSTLLKVELRNGLSVEVKKDRAPLDSSNLCILVRPEDVRLDYRPPTEGMALRGIILTSMFLGNRIECTVRVEELGMNVSAIAPVDSTFARGKNVFLSIPPESCVLLSSVSPFLTTSSDA